MGPNLDPEQWKLLAFGVAAAVIVAALLTIVARRSAGVGERLVQTAREAGWQNPVRMAFLAAGVRGNWNGFAAATRRVPRQKAIPERVLTRIQLRAPARLRIQRRTRALFGRPVSLFGPPLIDLRDGSGREFWIRADEITLAERLFGASAIADHLRRNLVTRFDTVTLSENALQIVRAAGMSARFGMAGGDELAQIAREEWELSKAIIDALSLRP